MKIYDKICEYAILLKDHIFANRHGN